MAPTFAKRLQIALAGYGVVVVFGVVFWALRGLKELLTALHGDAAFRFEGRRDGRCKPVAQRRAHSMKSTESGRVVRFAVASNRAGDGVNALSARNHRYFHYLTPRCLILGFQEMRSFASNGVSNGFSK